MSATSTAARASTPPPAAGNVLPNRARHSRTGFLIRLGRRLYTLRGEIDLSLHDCAVRAEITVLELMEIEAGNVDIPLDVLARLADALEIELLHVVNVGTDPRSRLIEALRVADSETRDKIVRAINEVASAPDAKRLVRVLLGEGDKPAGRRGQTRRQSGTSAKRPRKE